MEILKIRQKGLVPNVITYSAAISGCDKAKQLGKAERCLVVIPLIGLEPNVITYSAAISVCVCQGQAA